uniref:Uncharacterized protein n=1 Tax=Plectus sambesii TaxID=2011161 RepID=A0A914W3N6_9BILA
MNNTSTLLCSYVQLSFADGYLTTAYVIQTVVCLALLPLAIALCVAIGKTTVLHRNVRICLVSIAVSTVISNVGTVATAGYHLIAVFGSAENFCDRIALTSRECSRIQVIRSVGGLSTVIGLFFLAIERVCSTIQFKTYEKSGSTMIGIVLTLLQWLVSSLSFAGLLRAPRNSEERESRHPYCSVVALHPHTSSIFFYCMFAAQMLGLLIFISLAVVNKRKMREYTFNHALRLLSVRYQLKENVKTTIFLIPICASSCLVYGITLVALMFFVNQLPSDDDDQQLTDNIALQQIHFARVMEVVSLSTPAFTATFIAVVMRYNSHIRQNFVACFGRVKIPRRISKITDQSQEALSAKEQYFEALKKQWQ